MSGLTSKQGQDLLQYVQQHGLPFTDLRLFSRALTHRSYRNEHSESLEDNERLEFLGDAVLDFLVGAWLYHQYPEMAEGELTRLRSALVRTEQLAEFAVSIELGKVMRLGRGETETGGNNRPALLCATFEAVVGAIYLESGLASVQSFIEPMLAEATAGILESRREQDDKSLLQEAVQALGFSHPVYKTIKAYGPDHEKVFEVEVSVDGKAMGVGIGSSKQAAAKAAAKNALTNLEMS